MVDKTPAEQAPAEQAPAGQTPAGQAPGSPPRSRERNPGTIAILLALLLGLAALAVSGWTWIDSRSRFVSLQQETARRLSEMGAINRESRLLADNAREAARDAEARLGQLEARMAEAQNQRLALESLYKELSGNRDEWTVAEVEQALLIANQQLQLAGNVKAALIALETADARLARLDRPQLTQLRRVIRQDIERLKAAPFVDVTGMAVRIDRLAAGIDALPLSMEARPSRAQSPAPAPESGFWSRLWAEAVQDLKELVRIQNSADPAPPLVTPEQAYFLRENLRLRLLGARLALLARDQALYREDLVAASAWLARYFDTRDKAVSEAKAAVDQLARAEVNIDLPDISASLEAARGLRLVRERSLR